MNWYKSFTAVFVGLKLCFFKPEVRKLSFWPWLIGAVVYILVSIGAIYLHPYLLNHLVSVPSGFFSTLFYYLVWLGLTLFMIVVSMLVTLIVVLILTSLFQTSIAEKVLELENISYTKSNSGLSGIANEIVRTIRIEAVKLLWLVPLFILVFVIGFIPILIPVAIIMGAWLLAYSSIDVVLDVFKLSARARLKFALSHSVSLVFFGLSLMCFALIPFAGFLLPPIAVAGAAWLISEHKELLIT